MFTGLASKSRVIFFEAQTQKTTAMNETQKYSINYLLNKVEEKMVAKQISFYLFDLNIENDSGADS